jgi:hypothetical protein
LLALGHANARADAEGALARARAEARARGLAQSRMWQVLVHYRPGAFGGWKSEADGMGFFLAGRRGQTDPQAELDATLAAMLRAQPGTPEMDDPRCRFPARTAWLKQALGIDDLTLPPRACPLFDFWHNAIAADAATLVYATAYLNSPASMYGHTFLRLSRSTGEGNPLLDYIVNFGADINTRNGIIYAIKGLTGGFQGHFYVMPYYVKVQEYSNMESRDLWEYQLSLTREQVDRLVQHAWETRSTHFDYYFITENCSYQLLTLLEVANPDLHLVDAFAGAVIPADTIRVVLAQRGLVRGEEPRPAILSSMTRRRSMLSPPEVGAAERWAIAPAAASPPDLAKMGKERQALVIDAAYEYMRFREGLSKEPGEDFKKRERKMLLARGRLGVPPEVVTAHPAVGAPELGHATLRLTAGGGFSNDAGPFQRLSVRGALHDYLDPPNGYPADAELEMMDLRLQFDDQSRRVRLDRLDGLNILSALPYDRWIRGLSWKVWAGADNARELGCDRPSVNPHGWSCLYGGVTTGVGVAARFGPGRRGLAYLLADADVGAGPAFADAHAFRVGGGAEASVDAAVTSWWHWQLAGRYFYYPLGLRGGALRGRIAEAFRLGPRAALRVGAATAGTYAEASAELCAYF